LPYKSDDREFNDRTIVNNKLERIQKETMKAKFKTGPCYTGICLDGPRESMTVTINISETQTEIMARACSTNGEVGECM
jgi:hypothetical protein